MPYQFRIAGELLALCKKHKKSISEVAILREMDFKGKPRSYILNEMRKVKLVMQEAVKNGIRSNEKAFMNLAGGQSVKIMKMMRKTRRHRMMNKLALRAMAYATATGETNACMGRIVGFPTAGGAGVVPGVVLGMMDDLKLKSETVLRGLFTASAVGLIIAENATLSAAAAGCQAEVGAAMAMGAAAATEMRGGTPEEALNASALVLKSYLGVACDPLGGLVAVPCIKRNALGCVSALAASDLSMAGIASYVPFDEVVEALWRIGQLMSPKIKETALGGLAVTPTGLKIRKSLGLPDIKEDFLPVSHKPGRQEGRPGRPLVGLKPAATMIKWGTPKKS